MAGQSEPPTEEAKLQNTETVFDLFHEDEELHIELNNSLDFLQKSPIAAVCLLKIKLCNASYGCAFSNSICYTERHLDAINTATVYAFGGLFKRGLKVVKSYIRNPKCLPEDRGERIAMENLLTILKDTSTSSDIEKALGIGKSLNETEWTVRLVHHLLSRLAITPRYIMDNHSSGKLIGLICPCCNESLTGEFGDTFIGADKGWHGCLDIILGLSPDVPVKIAGRKPDSPSGSQVSDEVKVQDELVHCRHQVLAETIVFSFLQRKYHPEYRNYLIPTIAISKQQASISFYDSEHDILLQSPSFPLFTRNHLNKQTILALWLSINYKYFCTGIPKTIAKTNFKADFPKHIDAEKMVIYKNDVCFGCSSIGYSSTSSPSEGYNPCSYGYLTVDDCINSSSEEENDD